MAIDPSQLTQMITAVGALGTAAFGLLEAVKPVLPAINRIGFGGIKRTVTSLTPPEPGTGAPLNSLPGPKVIDSLLANWINGTDLASQKAIAKSLIKLHMSPGNAIPLAAAANVDPQILTDISTSIKSGTALTQPQSDTYSRFDLIVTAMLDQCYQKADQLYRNWTRGLAAFIAIVLALVGGFTLETGSTTAATMGTFHAFWTFIFTDDGGRALIVGLLATPLAPIAKDLSSALATAVNAMQVVKKS